MADQKRQDVDGDKLVSQTIASAYKGIANCQQVMEALMAQIVSRDARILELEARSTPIQTEAAVSEDKTPLQFKPKEK